MRKIYGKDEDWTKKNWKNSFENLANDGYSFEKIKLEDWFYKYADAWKIAVMVNRHAQKVIKETEKAICFNIVNQYGNTYDLWFPKKAVKSY